MKLQYSNEPVLLGHTSMKLGRSWIVPVYYPQQTDCPAPSTAYEPMKAPVVPPRRLGANSSIVKVCRLFESVDKEDLGVTIWQIHEALPSCSKESIMRQLSKNKDLFWREEKTVDIKFKLASGKWKVAQLARWHRVTPVTQEVEHANDN